MADDLATDEEIPSSPPVNLGEAQNGSPPNVDIDEPNLPAVKVVSDASSEDQVIANLQSVWDQLRDAQRVRRWRLACRL